MIPKINKYISLMLKLVKFIKPVANGFYHLGHNSKVCKPYLQLTGTDKISIGDNTTILDGARICVYGDANEVSIEIGDRCYIGFGVTLLALAGKKIKIGHDVLLASNILITSECHGMNPEIDVPYMDQLLSGDAVDIGDGCWLGERVCILPGVKIGKKCIIGAGSVVTKSVPDYSIVVGNPAKVIKRYNFDNHIWEKINYN